jgi:hypothetical protein
MVAKAAMCFEGSVRSPDGYLGAINACSQVGRGLPTMPQLDSFARSSGQVSDPEWTASVYSNPDNGPSAVEQLEAVLIDGNAQVSYDRVYLAVQHAFRCVAPPSN